MSDAVHIFLAGVACTLRVCQQVPAREYSPEVFLEVLEGTLDSRRMRKAPKATIDRVRAHQGDLDEMLTDLRQMYGDPTLLLLDPSEDPPH